MEHTMTPLRRRMTEDMRLRNLAPRTIQVYTARAAAFAGQFGRSPEALGRDDVRSFLLHLVRGKKVSWCAYTHTVAAPRFLSEVMLEPAGVMARVPCPKQPKRLPTVPSPDETARFFGAVIGIKPR